MIERGIVVELRNGEFGVVSDVIPDFMVNHYTEVYKKPYKYRVAINNNKKVLVTSLDIVNIYVRLDTWVSVYDWCPELKSMHKADNISVRNKELNYMIVKFINNLEALLSTGP